MGIYGELAIWLHSFLNGRTQQVIVDGKCSKIANITSGVPQGTVLGPICFLILINSINDKEIPAFLSSFADDTKLGLGINDEYDAQKLQDSLEALYDWQTNNNMEFNTTKFQVLQFGNKETKLKYN